MNSRGHKDFSNKGNSRGKRICFKCGKFGHFIANYSDNDDQEQKKNTEGNEKKKFCKKNKGWTQTAPTPNLTTWDSSPLPSTNPLSSPTSVTPASWLRRRRYSLETLNYTSCNEDFNDDDIDYSDLFKGLDRSKVTKINELIDALNEKDRLIEKQDDLLFEEHDKVVQV
jgi:hypothetical protein